MMLKLLVVDDQALFRDALCTLLALQPDFAVVGEAGTGEQAIEAARKLGPDVVLMDLRMPGIDGAEATRRILASRPSARVIVLTTFEEDEEVFRSVRAGAAGYLLKASPSEKLCDAIRRAAKGESILEPTVAAKVLSEFNRISSKLDGLAGSVTTAPALSEPLSSRESEVLRCLSRGLSNKEIGSELHIAEGTVKNHVSQLLAKLGALDRTQAALKGRDLNLL